MSGYARLAGKTYMNKYGVLEVHPGTSKMRRKLIPVDRLDRVWQVVDRGAIVVDEKTTHVRFLMHRVPEFGSWDACDGVNRVLITNDFAGEIFDQVVKTHPGVTWTFDSAGMFPPDASPLIFQELIVEEGNNA
jgi:hypothetical protein